MFIVFTNKFIVSWFLQILKQFWSQRRLTLPRIPRTKILRSL